jgi:hypothetical protein
MFIRDLLPANMYEAEDCFMKPRTLWEKESIGGLPLRSLKLWWGNGGRGDRQ